MKRFIIAISREYGSGGRGIGRKLAQALGVTCYDKEIISMTAEKSGLAVGYIEQSEENVSSSLLLNVNSSTFGAFSSVMFYDTPTTDKMFIAQSAVIRDIAARESCVIVGRCADYILREDPDLVRVFIRADAGDRVARAIEEYSLPQKNAEAYVKKTDKSRANYYKFYTNRTWGDKVNTDLMINSSFTGVDSAVTLIKTLIENK
jgi:cytidylate kinase